jgi:hypothetical protein
MVGAGRLEGGWEGLRGQEGLRGWEGLRGRLLALGS